MEAEERRYHANGIELLVARWGHDDGRPPLVLLHGIWDNWRTFLPVAAALGARRAVYAIDLRGHGASDKPLDHYTYDDYASDVEALLPQLTPTPVHLLGFSLGGLVAARVVARHSALVARLVLEDPPLPSARRASELIQSFESLLALKRLPVPEIVEEFALLYPNRSPEAHVASAAALVNTADGPFLAFTKPGGAQIELAEDLNGIEIPVLIARADPEAGGSLPDASLALLRAACPTARVVDFQGSGHAVHAERPEAFAAAVERFLS